MIIPLVSSAALSGLLATQNSKKKTYQNQKDENKNETLKNLDLKKKMNMLDKLSEEISQREENVEESFSTDFTSLTQLTYNDTVVLNFEYRMFRLVLIFLTCIILMATTLRNKFPKDKPISFLTCCIVFPFFITFNGYTIYVSYKTLNKYLSGVPLFFLLSSIIIFSKIIRDKISS
jgi:hypothetical protein